MTAGGVRRTFHWPTHQEVALFAKHILQLCAKHRNLSIVPTVSLEEDDKGRFNATVCDHRKHQC